MLSCFVENRHQQLTNNSSDEEAESGEEEHHRNTSSKSLNIEEEDEDILYMSDVPPDHNLKIGECIKCKSGVVGTKSANKNKGKILGKSANRSPEKLSTGTERHKIRFSGDKQNNQGEEDDDSSEVSSDESEGSNDDSDFQCPTDTSLSDLENASDMTSRKLNMKREKQSLNRSKTRNCELDGEETGNNTIISHAEKSPGKTRDVSERTRNVKEKTFGMGIKAKQDTSKQQESPCSRKGNRRSMSTKKSILKSKDNGAKEVHGATYPFTAHKKIIEGDETSNGQMYSSDDDIGMETHRPSSVSLTQEKSKQPIPNHLTDMSFESEWEEMTQFPGLYSPFVYSLYINTLNVFFQKHVY